MLVFPRGYPKGLCRHKWLQEPAHSTRRHGYPKVSRDVQTSTHARIPLCPEERRLLHTRRMDWLSRWQRSRSFNTCTPHFSRGTLCVDCNNSNTCQYLEHTRPLSQFMHYTSCTRRFKRTDVHYIHLSQHSTSRGTSTQWDLMGSTQDITIYG